MKLSDINPRVITAVAIGIPIILLLTFIIGLFIPDREAIPAVSSTSPQDGEEEVILSQPVAVYFQEDLDASQQSNISFRVEPTFNLSQEWVAANTLELTSAQLPESATDYTVTISYKNKEIYSFSFQTTTKTQEQIVAEGQQQAADDFLFGEAEKEFYKTYPWYQELPIETTDYVVVYNFERNAFRIRLTLGDNPTSAEREAAKSDALRDIENIGVDLTKFDYYVLTD